MNLNDILIKLKLKKAPAEAGEAQKNEPTKNAFKDKKNRPILVLRLLSFLIIFLLILAVMFTVYFVYSSIINSIGQIQSIISYRSEVNIELIDFNRLDKIEKYWTEKTDSKLSEIKRDPFVDVPIYDPETATSTSE